MITQLITSGGLDIAAGIIKRGGLAAVPTETVYGLAANGLDADAVAKIYEVKGRPEQKPLSLLVLDIAMAQKLCEVTREAETLASAFWPGPLTMVLKKRAAVPDIITANGDTVGVRCPDHPLTLELLQRAGVPLAAPSANPSGMPSPKTPADVLSYFGGAIDCVIDGGVCSLGTESTIIDLTVRPFSILRHGALPEAAIFSALDKAR